MPFRVGPIELVIVLVIVMMVFGVGRLPEIGGALGKSIRSFKRSVTATEEEFEALKAEVEKATKETTEN